MMSMLLRSVIVVVAMVASGAPSVAASPAGATSCSGCHSMRDGESSTLPGIYGREPNDTLAAMLAFRDNSRPATVMNRIAKGFSDDELRAIAAWLAMQK